jgi:light-regulated signal transduction histidine kinase (bacteriophytochrome)
VNLFEQQKVRTHWDEKKEKWYFSIVDVIAILTDSVNPRDYWFKMKQRVKTEDGLELSTVCRQLKMKASDAHGGELKVETKEGEGLEFIITLPQ